MVRGGERASRLGSISRFEQTRWLNWTVGPSGTVAATKDDTRRVATPESAIVSLLLIRKVRGNCHNGSRRLSQSLVVK